MPRAGTRLIAAAAFVSTCAAASVMTLSCTREDSASKKNVQATSPNKPAAPSKAPGEIAYVPNDVCVQCHGDVAEKWRTSHHYKAMARATDETVLGDFANTEFTHAGITSRFFKRDGKFFVHTDGPDGRLADFEIAYTFGVDPIQQYLVELPRGRIQCLTIAWDTARRRWFDLYPSEKTPPGDMLHWTGGYQNWNSMCADCHTTNLRKNYDPIADGYATTWSEINVSCQSCHGPGEEHVEWARATRPGSDCARGANGLVVDFRDARREVDTCAPCHSRRTPLTAAAVPGEPLYDDYLPALLSAGLYHPDGQQLDEVYVYGSFVQSKMYRAGVRCSDCHDPHSAKLIAEGNALCVRCHQLEPDTTRFPGLRPKSYDSPAHHFHEAGSPGAQCVSCHMPENTYMIIDPRRDHGLRIPRPDLTVKLGTPNACTNCHTDHDAKWAADAAARWYGPAHGGHFAEVIAAGRAGAAEAEDDLAALAQDATEAPIVRATALDLLAGYGARSVGASVAATHDADPVVREAALTSLERVPGEDRVAIVAPLLRDPLRAVRIEAARVLSSSPAQALDEPQRRAYDAALAEFVAAQNVSLDTPGAHLNLAVVYANGGNHAEAEAYYRKALELDPDFTPARLNFARLLNGLGRNADAAGVLRDGITRVPNQGEMHYSLGLLLAEDQKLAEAVAELDKAAELLPDRARVRYNLALARQQSGDIAGAERALVGAQQLDPGDPDILYALTSLYAQRADWPHALAWAEKLAVAAPDQPGVDQLVNDLRARSKAPSP